MAAFSCGVPHRCVFELRYEQGEFYWDRCGRIARQLAAREGWELKSLDFNGCHICQEEKNLIFSYTPSKLDLTQSQNRDISELMPPAEFAAIATEFSGIVIEVLDINTFPRIGFRHWTLFGTESIEEASKKIGEVSFFRPCEALSDLGELSLMSHSVVITRPDFMVRVAIAPFEQQINIAPSVLEAAKAKASHRYPKEQRSILLQKLKAKKAIKEYPAVGMMIDLDAYIEDPEYPDQLSAQTFVENAMEDFGTIRMKVLT